MANTILIKSSATANSIPAAGNLSLGELALNYADGNLFYKNSSNVVTVIASNKFLSVTGNVTAGNLSGTSIVGTLTTAEQTNITSVGTLTSLAVTGNTTSGNISTGGLISATGTVTGSQFNGSGAGLTSISGANVTGTVPLATSATTAGTVTTAAQGNITSVGTLTSLNVTGNITGGNLSGTSIVGTLTTAAQNNITSIGTLGSLSVTGNITGGNVLGGANVNATTHTGTTVSVSANITGGNLVTGGLISATANITGGNLSGTSIVGTLLTAAQTNITSIGTLGSLSVSGNIISSGLVGIGTTTPVAKLAVVGGTTNASDLATAYSTAAFNITPKSTSGYSLAFGSGPDDRPYIQMSAAGTAPNDIMIQPYGGYVGIGTTVNNVYDAVAAQRPLVVQRSDTSTTLNGSSAAIAIVNGDTTTNNTAQLNFAAITGASTNQYSSAIISAIFGARTNAQYPTGQLVFSTSSATNSAPTEKVRITADGLVGIATTTPAALLQVGPTSAGAINGYTKFIVDSTDYAVATFKSPAANFSQIIFTDPTSAGLGGINYFNSTNATPNAMAFLTAATERMRIDSSGNVGIGTTSPIRKLTVSNAGTVEFVLQDTSQAANSRNWRIFNAGNELYFGKLNDAGTAGNDYLKIDSSGNVGIGMAPTNFGNGYTVLQVANATNGGMLYLTNTSNAGGRIYGNAAGLTYDAFGATYQAFYTNSVERMRIISNGNLVVTNNLDFVGGAATVRIHLAGGTPDSSNSGIAAAWNLHSDYRLKENINPIESALQKVYAMNPVMFTWKGEQNGKQTAGFIAHELAEHAPYAVLGEKDAVNDDGSINAQAADYSKVVPLLVAAIKEQQGMITALTARVTELEKT